MFAQLKKDKIGQRNQKESLYGSESYDWSGQQLEDRMEDFSSTDECDHKVAPKRKGIIVQDSKLTKKMNSLGFMQEETDLGSVYNTTVKKGGMHKNIKYSPSGMVLTSPMAIRSTNTSL